MEKYHKIQTIFKRNPETNFKTLLEGEYSISEFEYLKDNEWVFTEKVDGTNIRVMFDGESISFAGKTDRAQMPKQLEEKLKEIFLPQIEMFMDLFPDGVCLYGEGFGVKIQNGGKYLKHQDFVLFDVRVGNWWLSRGNVEEIGKNLNLYIVPEIGSGTLADMVEMVRNGFNSRWGNFQAEGIVARPKTELFARNGSRIITKLKCKDFR